MIHVPTKYPLGLGRALHWLLKCTRCHAAGYAILWKEVSSLLRSSEEEEEEGGAVSVSFGRAIDGGGGDGGSL